MENHEFRTFFNRGNNRLIINNNKEISIGEEQCEDNSKNKDNDKKRKHNIEKLYPKIAKDETSFKDEGKSSECLNHRMVLKKRQKPHNPMAHTPSNTNNLTMLLASDILNRCRLCCGRKKKINNQKNRTKNNHRNCQIEMGLYKFRRKMEDIIEETMLSIVE